MYEINQFTQHHPLPVVFMKVSSRLSNLTILTLTQKYLINKLGAIPVRNILEQCNLVHYKHTLLQGRY